MNVLIDTQILLYILFDKKKLSKKEKEIVLNEENQIFCSSVSFFEIALKYSIGKLILKNVTPEKIPSLMIKSGYIVEEVSSECMASFYKLPKEYHKDPFDRLIIWESINKGFFLLTRDRKIKMYSTHGLRVL